MKRNYGTIAKMMDALSDDLEQTDFHDRYVNPGHDINKESYIRLLHILLKRLPFSKRLSVAHDALGQITMGDLHDWSLDDRKALMRVLKRLDT